MAASPELTAAALCALLPACAASPASPGAGPAVLERRLFAMGTTLVLEVQAPDRATALQASEAAVRAIETVEGRLSTWRGDSELARLNAAPVGDEVELTDELAHDLALAFTLSRATGGAFDPAVGPLVEAWGLRTGGRRPGEGELQEALMASGLPRFELDGRRARRLHANARIEEGAFGKGRGLDAAITALEGAGADEATVDLGGQLAFLGEARRTCALADPRDRGRTIVELDVKGGSLATTSNSERGITVDGERLAHVLDPRTGLPVRDFGSVTVWARDATSADALSTALFVLGPDDALAFGLEHEGIELVVVEVVPDGLQVMATPGWRGRIRASAEDVQLNIIERN